MRTVLPIMTLTAALGLAGGCDLLTVVDQPADLVVFSAGGCVDCYAETVVTGEYVEDTYVEDVVIEQPAEAIWYEDGDAAWGDGTGYDGYAYADGSYDAAYSGDSGDASGYYDGGYYNDGYSGAGYDGYSSDDGAYAGAGDEQSAYDEQGLGALVQP